MRGLAKFTNVTRVVAPCEVAQHLRALQQQRAQIWVNRAIDAMLKGFAGTFLDDLINALIAKTADVAAAHKDGPFVSSMFGKHAARVCGSSRVDPMAAVHGAIKSAPDALAEVE